MLALSGLEGLVRALPWADRGVTALAQDGWGAVRVGRNDVWRVQRRAGSAEAYFAKFCRTPVGFRRELAGWRLARRMADGRAWLMAADVLVADDRDRVVVTRALPGVPLARSIRDALRRDRPRRGRPAALGRAQRALSLVIGWIDLLQQQDPSALDDPQDDRPGAVAARVAVKLGRLGAGGGPGGPWLPRGWPDRLGLDVPAADVPVGPVHGDLSFGNIVYSDDGAIGVIDFENLAIGPQFRDVIWVRYGLEHGSVRWYYRDGAPLLELLEVPRPEDRVAGLYRLEFVVDNLLALRERLAARPRVEWVLGLAERRWTRRELGRLGRLLVGPEAGPAGPLWEA